VIGPYRSEAGGECVSHTAILACASATRSHLAHVEDRSLAGQAVNLYRVRMSRVSFPIASVAARRATALRRAAALLAGAALCATALAACGGSNAATTTTSRAATSTTSPGATSTTGAGGSTTTVASGGGTPTVWLCQPGAPNDPCEAPLTATVVTAAGTRTIDALHVAAAPAADCFYVYPTVSTQTTPNSNLVVQPGEIDAAVAQASPFSQVCRVWAPMYRQETAAQLASPGGFTDTAAENIAYASLLSAWKDYLSRDNDGRPIVFIGHSQGAAMLIRLLQSQVDPVASIRARVLSAIILGGNVQVPTGKFVGGTFQNLPGCTSSTQTGCVIAYSSFHKAPPADSLFGRPGQGVSLQSNQTTSAGEQVLCTNPASLGGGAAALEASFPAVGLSVLGRKVTTPWVTYPGLYEAQCESAGGATWLSIDWSAGDPRPHVTASLGPIWGLHLDDVNLAMVNLVDDVANEESAFKG
jgi:hypothetical protein